MKAQLPGGVSELPGGDAVNHYSCKTNGTVMVRAVFSEDIYVCVYKKEEHLNGPGWIYSFLSINNANIPVCLSESPLQRNKQPGVCAAGG